MADVSYATARKIRIIKEKLGDTWEQTAAGRRIDAVYNELVGDNRKNLFCKLQVSTKAKLDEMVDDSDTKMAEFLEALINREYERFLREKNVQNQNIVNQFGS